MNDHVIDGRTSVQATLDLLDTKREH